MRRLNLFRSPFRSSAASTAARKPRDEEIDIHGLTHRGFVRPENEDHFLVCQLNRRVAVLATSLPDVSRLSSAGERLAFLAMVADGVGGAAMGQEASRLALLRATEYVASSLRCYYAADPEDDGDFAEALEEAAMRTHADIVGHAAGDPAYRGMATTLTLWLGIWPRAYLLQVGDSRCYMLRDDRLLQISRDQTMAQEMVEQGLLKQAEADRSRWSHVLSSAIGGGAAAPVVTRMEQGWDQVGLLCSDGLTKHVSDKKIRKRLEQMKSAKQACETLLDDALQDGGTDNITIVVGRLLGRDRN